MEVEFSHDEALLDEDPDPVHAGPSHAVPFIMQVAVEQTVLVVGITARLDSFPPLFTLTNAHRTT